MNDKMVVKWALIGAIAGGIYSYFSNGGWVCWVLSLLVFAVVSIVLRNIWDEERYKWIARHPRGSIYLGQGIYWGMWGIISILYILTSLTGYPTVLPLSFVALVVAVWLLWPKTVAKDDSLEESAG